jgi:hypothetical protein
MMLKEQMRNNIALRVTEGNTETLQVHQDVQRAELESIILRQKV